MPSDNAPTPQAPLAANRRKTPKRFKRVLLIFGSLVALFLVLLLILAGPAFPAAARYGALKAAATQGIEGDLKVEGSIFSGFAIREVELKGSDSPLVSLSLQSVELAYDFRALVSAAADLNWLRLLKVERAVIEIRVPITEETAAETPPATRADQAPFDFSPVWNLLQSEIEIEEVTVMLHVEAQRYEIASFHLHLPGGSEGAFKIESISLPNGEPITDLSAVIEPGERRLRLDQFSGKALESLNFLSLSEPGPGDWNVDAGITLGGGEITIHAATNGEVTLALADGQTIALDAIELPAGSPELVGTISELALNFQGDFENPSSWEIKGKVLGHDLGTGATTVDSLALLIEGNRLNLDVLAPGLRLTAMASAPLDQLTDTAGFARLPVDLSGNLSLESAEDLFTAWEIDAPVTGTLEGRLENIQFVGGKSLRSGVIDLRSDSLAWDGQRIPLLDVTARVTEPDQVRMDLEVALDDKSYLKGGGNFLLETLSYEGALIGEFASDGTLREMLDEVGVSFAGNLMWNGKGTLDPPAHEGKAVVNATDLTIKDGRPMSISLESEYRDEAVLVPSLRLEAGNVALNGKAGWQDGRLSIDELAIAVNDEPAMMLRSSLPLDPGGGQAFLEQPGKVELELSLTALPVEELLLLFGPEAPLAGNLNGNLTGSGNWENFSASGDFDFLPILDQPIGEPALKLELNLTGAAARPASWDANLAAILSNLKWDEIQLGDINLRAATRERDGGKWIDANLNATQEGATLTAETQLDLSGAEDFAALKERALDLSAAFDAPDLAPLWQQLAPPQWRNIPVAGALSLKVADARLKGTELLSGTVDLFTDTLHVDGEKLEKIELTGRVGEPNQVTADLALYFDEISRINGSGGFHLIDQAYDGQVDLSLDLKSNGVLKSLLGKREIARLLPGTVALALDAKGAVKEKTFAGEVDLKGTDLALADGASPITTFALGGTFSDSTLATSLALESEPLDLDGALNWDGKRFLVESLKGVSAGTPIFTANGSIPLSKETLSAETWFAQEEPLEFSLVSEPISLNTIMKLVKDAPPVNGDLDLDLTIKGTPALPDLELSAVLANIALPEQDNMKVGAISLDLKTADAKATLLSEYRHPDVNPLIIKASLPFFPKEWALKERDVQTEKITVSARMDRSSLAFLSTQVPAIRSIEGAIALDAEVTGTMKTPAISGDGLLDISQLRLTNRDAPSFYDIDLKTRFAKNRLTIERLQAIVAGGEVAAEGSIAFLPETEPKFDLRLGAKEALVFRTPDLSLRTDADLTLTGPWSAATISGEIGITNSRFFKNFDLLPQTLPTRNTSVLPTVERAPRGGGAAYTDLNLGVEAAPFKDWNADIRLFTKTPFQVRSNLVESDLVADIRIGGKLAAPMPTGFLAIDEGELSLPFSSVDVEIGRIEFDQNTGFNGAINLKAKAKADKYRINIFLYNRILDPKYVLTSVPPLPTEDLTTLLITGTTRDALIGGDTGSLAASKAATLLFKNMRKASAAADSEPTLLDELEERTELDIGGINPETGAQSVGGKIRLWKQLFFVGDVDAENDYRALLKYVFRFR